MIRPFTGWDKREAIGAADLKMETMKEDDE